MYLRSERNYYLDYGANIYACFVDFSKAFDRVDHTRLFNKLIDRNIPIFIVRILSYWYSFQTLAMTWGMCSSDVYHATNGVRQGGILSPFLYNCYTDGLSSVLSRSDIGCRIGDVIINHLLYADDMCIISSSVNGLQKLLNEVYAYCSEHDIIINVNKTKCVYFCDSRPVKIKHGRVKIGDVSVDVVENFKYLGHILHHTMDDTSDIMAQLRQFYGRGNTIVRKFGGCSNDVKRILFNSYCGSFYCSSLWTAYNDYTMNRLKVAYNNVFRKLHKLPFNCSASEMFVNNRVKTFLHLRRNAMSSLTDRLLDSKNTILQACVALKNSANHKSPFWHVRDFLLYPGTVCNCHSCT